MLSTKMIYVKKNHENCEKYRHEVVVFSWQCCFALVFLFIGVPAALIRGNQVLFLWLPWMKLRKSLCHTLGCSLNDTLKTFGWMHNKYELLQWWQSAHKASHQWDFKNICFWLEIGVICSCMTWCTDSLSRQ